MENFKKRAISLVLTVLMTASAVGFSSDGSIKQSISSKNVGVSATDVYGIIQPTNAILSLDETYSITTDETESLSFSQKPSIGLLSVSTASSNTSDGSETASSAVASSEASSSEISSSEVSSEPNAESGTESSVESQPESKPEETVPQLDKVKNIKYASYAADYVKLTWSAVKNADGYIIYYRDSDSLTSFKKVGTTKNTNVTVKKLKASTYYQFKICAYKKVSGRIYQGKYTVCNAVTAISGTGTPKLKNSSSYIQFTWTKNSKATGYQIYRVDTKTNGKWIKYKTIKNNKTVTFKDTGVSQGKSYYYKIRAYRTVGSKTYYSSFSIIRAVCGLASPKISSASTTLSKLTLKWNKNKNAYGYDIYIKGEKDTKYKYYATTTATSYTTKKLTPNTKYSVAIYPFRYVGANKLKVRGTCSIKTIKARNLAYGVDVGSSYIEIDIKKQRMQFYVNNKLYVDTPVVTGMDNGYNNTPKGAYKIFQRVSPATLYGVDYVTPVDYWLGFTYSGCGIHDATWRPSSDYVAGTYKYNGSHGCVNTPYSAVKKIYSKAKIGMYVVIY